MGLRHRQIAEHCGQHSVLTGIEQMLSSQFSVKNTQEKKLGAADAKGFVPPPKKIALNYWD
jgi:hypothetical protein